MTPFIGAEPAWSACYLEQLGIASETGQWLLGAGLLLVASFTGVLFYLKKRQNRKAIYSQAVSYEAPENLSPQMLSYLWEQDYTFKTLLTTILF